MERTDGWNKRFCAGLFLTVLSLLCIFSAASHVQAKVKSLNAGVTYNSTKKVTLEWDKTKSKKYIVYRAAGTKALKKPKYKKYKTLKGSAVKFVDKKVKMKRYYYYRICGFNARGKKIFQDDLEVHMRPEDIEFIYRDSSEENGYNRYGIVFGEGVPSDGIVVYRRDETAGQKSFKKLTKVENTEDGTFFADASAAAGHLYSYRIYTYIKEGSKTYNGIKKTMMMYGYDETEETEDYDIFLTDDDVMKYMEMFCKYDAAETFSIDFEVWPVLYETDDERYATVRIMYEGPVKTASYGWYTVDRCTGELDDDTGQFVFHLLEYTD